MGNFSSDRSIQDYADSVSVWMAAADPARSGPSSPTPFPRSNCSISSYSISSTQGRVPCLRKNVMSVAVTVCQHCLVLSISENMVMSEEPQVVNVRTPSAQPMRTQSTAQVILDCCICFVLATTLGGDVYPRLVMISWIEDV
jgi:hypothetical protein